MTTPRLLALTLPFLLIACGGDKDGDGGGTNTDTNGTNTTTDTDTTDTETVPTSPMEAFEANDWYGVAIPNEIAYEFDASANLDYIGNDQVAGQFELDQFWNVTLTLQDDGTASGSGTPVQKGQPGSLELSNMEVVDGVMTGDWVWDYGSGSYSGTVEMAEDGLAAE